MALILILKTVGSWKSQNRPQSCYNRCRLLVTSFSFFVMYLSPENTVISAKHLYLKGTMTVYSNLVSYLHRQRINQWGQKCCLGQKLLGFGDTWCDIWYFLFLGKESVDMAWHRFSLFSCQHLICLSISALCCSRGAFSHLGSYRPDCRPYTENRKSPTTISTLFHRSCFTPFDHRLQCSAS